MTARATPFMQFVSLILLMLLTMPLAAHSTPNAEVRLRATDNETVLADIVVPQGEYAYATGNQVDGSSASLRIARQYLAERIAVRSPDGRDWTVNLRTVQFVRADGQPDLHAVAELHPPPGASPRQFTIDWRVLTDTLPGHFAIFIVESSSGSAEASIVGAVRADSPRLDITIARQSALSVLGSAAQIGAHHIIEGYDHLLFLLTLLLPAPLIARSGKWAAPDSTRSTIIKLIKIVTAFTVGHSLTLVIAATAQWSLPVAPVEVAIAVSVLVAALHAARPLLPGKEPLVALLFGLVHGLAFATLVQEAQAGMASGALTMLGFNLGIELVQLGIVALVVPSLLVLSRYRFYGALRQTLAALCAAAAIAWIINRTTGLADGAVTLVETAIAHGVWLVLAASLVAIGLAVKQRFGLSGRPNAAPAAAV